MTSLINNRDRLTDNENEISSEEILKNPKMCTLKTKTTSQSYVIIKL